MISGKTIIFGVCGGIAAYKGVEAVSRLVKAGVTVHVIMTEAADKICDASDFSRNFRSTCIYLNVGRTKTLECGTYCVGTARRSVRRGACYSKYDRQTGSWYRR